jgi:uncharacterized protein involved in outer membrane biogenesis
MLEPGLDDGLGKARPDRAVVELALRPVTTFGSQQSGGLTFSQDQDQSIELTNRPSSWRQAMWDQVITGVVQLRSHADPWVPRPGA